MRTFAVLAQPDRARRTLAATLAILLAVPALALWTLAQPAGAQEDLRVTTPVRITAEDPRPARTYQSPDMAVLPDDPTTAVAASPDLRARQCRFLRSTNSGHSWELLDTTPMPDPDTDDCFHTGGTLHQTPIATGGDGRVYYGLSSWPSEGVGPQDHAASEVNAHVAFSDDLGESWTTTMVRDATDFEGDEGFEGNRITGVAVDPRSGDDDVVYATWSTRYGGMDDEDEPVSQPNVAVSTDGGQSFGEPIVPIPADVEEELGGENGLSGGSAQLAMGDDGTLYVVFEAEPAAEDEAARLVVTSTDDQGESWTYNEVTDPEQVPDYSYHMVAWSPEGGENGSLHVVYESDMADQPQGQRDIFHQRSTDGGESWSDPQMLNDDGPDSYAGQYHATVDVAPNGRVDVAWYDFRDGQERFANDVYYAFSDDNGDTWSENVRVSDQSANRHLGTWTNDFDMRAPPGIASTDDFVLLGWSDTRNADQAGQSQDIYGAAVQHDELGGSGASTLPIVLAAVGGLFAAGVLLFGVGLGVRLRGSGSGSGRPAPAGN